MLIPFKKRVLTELKDSNGLDSILYLLSMRNEMSCVIYDHLHQTLNSARMPSEVQSYSYNKQNITNNMASVAFLLHLLASDLAESVLERLKEQDSCLIEADEQDSGPDR